MKTNLIISTIVTLLLVSKSTGEKSGNAISPKEFEDPTIRNMTKRQAVSTCYGGYQTVVNSTMCARDSPLYVRGSSGVTQEEIKMLVDLHNLYRSKVSPPATNMMKMTWDEELARIAEKWAKQCVVGHDKSRYLSRYIPAYGDSPGQNAAFGYRNWRAAIEGWYKEKEKYRYGENPAIYIGENALQKVGHYSQMMTATSMIFGCGFARCRFKFERFYICNYLTPQYSVERPYKRGRTCADCPNKCRNGLCDCGNNYCFNGGSLNINTCRCSCRSPFSGSRCLRTPCPGLACKHGGKLNTATCSCDCNYPYSGKSCETIKCGQRPDPPHCGTQWPKSYCDKYVNVKWECAVMCGLCKAPCRGLTCLNGGRLDAKTCSCKCQAPLFSGRRCATKNCPRSDPFYCGTQWPQSHCKTFSNVPKECPIMCGICTDPCRGKKCQNNGKLNTNTCTCSCPERYRGNNCQFDKCPRINCQNGGKLNVNTCRCSCNSLYSGRLCSKKNCPNSDPFYCGTQWPKEYCDRYSNVPTSCPIMCGLCSGRCTGITCRNGGTLDAKTCKCSCDGLHMGKFCEKRICPRKDPYYCGTQWPKSYCTQFSNVPTRCPIMCGLCSDPCNGKTCQNDGELNANTCTCKCPKDYQGDRCQLKRCAGVRCQNGGTIDSSTCKCFCNALTSGDFCQRKNCPKIDPPYCGTQWPKSFCKRYSNVPTGCPIMCGLCSDPCRGKTCQNGGRLNPDSCQCSCQNRFTGSSCQTERCRGISCRNGGTLNFKTCRCSCGKIYSGRLCQQKNCPQSDPFYCGTQWPVSYCKKYSNVPGDCPFMCGLC